MATEARTISIKDAVGILNSRTPISSEGKYTVKVTNCGDYHKALENGGAVVAIANFNAMSPYQMEQAKALLAEGKNAEALNNNLSLSIRDKDYRPAKGEIVDIEVGYITTKSGEQALMVTSLTPRQAVSVATKCDFSSFLEDAELVSAEGAAASEEELD